MAVSVSLVSAGARVGPLAEIAPGSKPLSVASPGRLSEGTPRSVGVRRRVPYSSLGVSRFPFVRHLVSGCER